MDASPMPRVPRSPWKKTRRGSEADLRFDDDYDSECARLLLSIAAMRRAGRLREMCVSPPRWRVPQRSAQTQTGARLLSR